MNFRKNGSWYDEEMLNSVNRYEDMLENHKKYFFDVHEFEDIIDYYMDTDNFSQAAQAADYAMHLYPSSTSIQLRIAEILIDNSQPVKALSLLNKLEHLESGEYGVYLLKGTALNMLGKPREAQRQFEVAISLADENKIEVLYNIGISFERINQHKIALKYFMKVHSMEPDNYYVFYDLAYCYERINELDKSISYYLMYLDEDPFSEHVWYNLGIVYNKKDENEKALDAYDYAIVINENYSSAYFNKANTLTLLDRHREAINVYKDFLLMEPDSAAAHCYMAESYERIRKEDLAIIHYEKSLALDNKFADAWFGLGVIRSQAGNYQEAIHDIQNAVELDEDNSEYLFVQASVYANMKQYEKAIKIFKRLATLISNDEMMWDSFAQVYAKQKSYTDVQQIITQALQFNPDSAMLRYHLAAYYLLNDDRLQGLTILKETLNKYPAEVGLFFELFDKEVKDPEVMALVDRFRIGKK